MVKITNKYIILDDKAILPKKQTMVKKGGINTEKPFTFYEITFYCGGGTYKYLLETPEERDDLFDKIRVMLTGEEKGVLILK